MIEDEQWEWLALSPAAARPAEQKLAAPEEPIPPSPAVRTRYDERMDEKRALVERNLRDQARLREEARKRVREPALARLGRLCRLGHHATRS